MELRRVSQTVAPLTVGGNLAATTDANNGVIDMGTLAVDGRFTLAPDGTGAVTIVNADGLTFSTSTLGGTLNATATTGNINDMGTLTVTGTSTLTTSANNANINLNNSNAFTGAITISTTGSNANASIKNVTTALEIAESSVGGNLTLTSKSDISLTGNIAAKGLTLTADSNIVLKADVETRVGSFTATADANNNENGTFTLDAGKTITSADNVTIEAFKIEELGTINATGVKKLTIKFKPPIPDEELIDAAEEVQFLQALSDIATKGC